MKNLIRSRNFKRIFACLAVVLIMGAMAVPCFAAEGDAASEAVSAMNQGFSTITGTLSIGNIIKVAAIALGVCVGFMFFWWGIRKVIRMVTAAFKKGKVSV